MQNKPSLNIVDQHSAQLSLNGQRQGTTFISIGGGDSISQRSGSIDASFRNEQIVPKLDVESAAMMAEKIRQKKANIDDLVTRVQEGLVIK